MRNATFHVTLVLILVVIISWFWYHQSEFYRLYTGPQSDTTRKELSSDGKCGYSSVVIDGVPGNDRRCPYSQCCSEDNACGGSRGTQSQYCSWLDGVWRGRWGGNFDGENGSMWNEWDVPISTDGRCGPSVNKACPPGQCCSQSGWCGGDINAANQPFNLYCPDTHTINQDLFYRVGYHQPWFDGQTNWKRFPS